ncbi:MAG: hypothetical protein HZC36_14990 [Armatimonadetes bacterium]|nr:hypothetical protein [Armatimonadota bacterium]
MALTSKERMLTALAMGAPDRVPITIHQWQPYHLKQTMGGMGQLEAFQAVGLDASIETYSHLSPIPSSNWSYTTVQSERSDPTDESDPHDEPETLHQAETPDGTLSWKTVTNPTTTFITEHPVKTEQDAEIFLKHYPGKRFDAAAVSRVYDEAGDAGIVRGFITMFNQCGPWQDFCELVGTQQAIFWALDDAAFVHHVLDGLTAQREREILGHMAGLKLDLVECGGGAASATVISPAMFQEFCVPYDRRINEALRSVGLKSVYHTCGGMMPILDLIPLNATDASETLSPPEVGGDITPERRAQVKSRLGARLPIIGGVNQALLENGTPAQIEADVTACFEAFGTGGGYICSASDHFFEAPIENLRAMVRAANECRY